MLKALGILVILVVIFGAVYFLYTGESPAGLVIGDQEPEESVTSATLEIINVGQEDNNMIMPNVRITNTGNTDINPRFDLILSWSEPRSTSSMQRVGGGGSLNFISDGQILETISPGTSIPGRIDYSKTDLRVGNYKLVITLKSDGQVLDTQEAYFKVELIS